MLKLTGNLEQKLMDILWTSDNPLKPLEVQEKLEKKLAYSTIKTTLERMLEKGLVKRDMQGSTYFYSPVINKEKYGKTNLKGVFGDILGSYGKLALSQFVETIKENPENLKLLQKYLDDNKK